MNLRQAERVDELFRKRIDKGIKDYLNKWAGTPEYFFIKNLENAKVTKETQSLLQRCMVKRKKENLPRFAQLISIKGKIESMS